MYIEEMIKKLEEIKEKNGNLEVYFDNECENMGYFFMNMMDIEELEVRKDEDDENKKSVVIKSYKGNYIEGFK